MRSGHNGLSLQCELLGSLGNISEAVTRGNNVRFIVISVQSVVPWFSIDFQDLLFLSSKRSHFSKNYQCPPLWSVYSWECQAPFLSSDDITLSHFSLLVSCMALLLLISLFQSASCCSFLFLRSSFPIVAWSPLLLYGVSSQQSTLYPFTKAILVAWT